MIKAEEIEIEEFRGIRQIKLSLAGRNFAICGPNGTGKSGIVDALEFILTGNISRISGRGAGELSVKRHGPHVDAQSPEKARVKLTVSIPSLNERVLIERTVADANLLKIHSTNPKAVRIIEEVTKHPEIVLSRRELIRYILATPGDRSKEVQTLLRLDKIEDVRIILQRIANSSDRELKNVQREKETARKNLVATLKLPDLSAKAILDAANANRALLNVDPIATFTATTSLTEGLTTDAAKTGPALIKNDALATMAKMRSLLEELAGTAVAQRTSALELMNSLRGEQELVNGLEREEFLNAAIRLTLNDSCPVCDTEWDIHDLHARVRKKLSHLAEISKRRKTVERLLQPLVDVLERVEECMLAVEKYGSLLKPPIDVVALTQARRAFTKQREHLMRFLPVDETIETLSGTFSVGPEPSSILEDSYCPRLISFRNLQSRLPRETC